MTMGRRPEAVEGVDSRRRAPAAGAGRAVSLQSADRRHWDPQGNIFVSDGYVNSRVVKYDKNGRFIKSVGDARHRAVSVQHAALDHGRRARATSTSPIAATARIQVFDNDLMLRAIYDNVGAPWAVCISPGPASVSVQLELESRTTTTRCSRPSAGEIYKMELDGTIIGKFGKPGKQLGEFSTVHEIDCRNPNELFVSEITAWRVQKIILKPQAPQLERREVGGA